jgi:hypothetical protein
MTEARLAALLEGGSRQSSGIKLLGWDVGPQGPPHTNIQLVAGSALGTGSTSLQQRLWELSSQHEALAQHTESKWGAAVQPAVFEPAKLHGQPSSTASAPLYRLEPLGVKAAPVSTQQRVWTDSSSGRARVLTAAAAAAVARDRQYYERVQTLLGSHASTQQQLYSPATAGASSRHPQLKSQPNLEGGGRYPRCSPQHSPSLQGLMALPLPHGRDRHPSDTVLCEQQYLQCLDGDVDKCSSCGCTMTSCCGCCCSLLYGPQCV